MDERTENPESREEGYVARPVWQVWMARVGLVFMILFVIYQLLTIATGGF